MRIRPIPSRRWDDIFKAICSTEMQGLIGSDVKVVRRRSRHCVFSSQPWWRRLYIRLFGRRRFHLKVVADGTEQHDVEQAVRNVVKRVNAIYLGESTYK
jgi:hypothetical protein